METKHIIYKNFNNKNNTPDTEINIKNIDASINNIYLKLKFNDIH